MYAQTWYTVRCLEGKASGVITHISVASLLEL